MATDTKTKAPQFSTRIDISPERRAGLIELLNQSLADISDLSSQVHVAHWNVKGPGFYQFHLMFEEMYNELAAFADDIAERATTLGGYAHGTVRDAARNSGLPELTPEIVDGLPLVTALAERYAQFAAELRQAIDTSEDHGDKSTADLYTEISRAVDKRLWFLEAHLQGK